MVPRDPPDLPYGVSGYIDACRCLRCSPERERLYLGVKMEHGETIPSS
jgi:hypothetical protein